MRSSMRSTLQELDGTDLRREPIEVRKAMLDNRGPFRKRCS